jgi:hypothetical protein
LKPFSDWEIISECLEVIEVVAFPDKKHIISEFSLSGFTIGRRIGEV